MPNPFDVAEQQLGAAPAALPAAPAAPAGNPFAVAEDYLGERDRDEKLQALPAPERVKPEEWVGATEIAPEHRPHLETIYKGVFERGHSLLTDKEAHAAYGALPEKQRRAVDKGLAAMGVTAAMASELMKRDALRQAAQQEEAGTLAPEASQALVERYGGPGSILGAGIGNAVIELERQRAQRAENDEALARESIARAQQMFPSLADPNSPAFKEVERARRLGLGMPYQWRSGKKVTAAEWWKAGESREEAARRLPIVGGWLRKEDLQAVADAKTRQADEKAGKITLSPEQRAKDQDILDDYAMKARAMAAAPGLTRGGRLLKGGVESSNWMLQFLAVEKGGVGKAGAATGKAILGLVKGAAPKIVAQGAARLAEKGVVAAGVTGLNTGDILADYNRRLVEGASPAAATAQSIGGQFVGALAEQTGGLLGEAMRLPGLKILRNKFIGAMNRVLTQKGMAALKGVTAATQWQGLPGELFEEHAEDIMRSAFKIDDLPMLKALWPGMSEELDRLILLGGLQAGQLGPAVAARGAAWAYEKGRLDPNDRRQILVERGVAPEVADRIIREQEGPEPAEGQAPATPAGVAPAGPAPQPVAAGQPAAGPAAPPPLAAGETPAAVPAPAGREGPSPVPPPAEEAAPTGGARVEIPRFEEIQSGMGTPGGFVSKDGTRYVYRLEGSRASVVIEAPDGQRRDVQTRNPHTAMQFIQGDVIRRSSAKPVEIAAKPAAPAVQAAAERVPAAIPTIQGQPVETHAPAQKRATEMTEAELRSALLVDRNTGLPNVRAYRESEARPFEAVIRAPLKKFNKLGHDQANAMLQAVGRALEAKGLRAYRETGPRLLVPGADQAELARVVAEVKAELGRKGPGGHTIDIDFEIRPQAREQMTAKRSEQMSREELTQNYLTDPLTGLPNARAFDEAPDTGRVLAWDINWLGKIAAKFGDPTVDQIMKYLAQLSREAGVPMFRLQERGDEFAAKPRDEAEEKSFVEGLTKTLESVRLTGTTLDGHRVWFRLEVTHGTGTDYESADADANQRKGEKGALVLHPETQEREGAGRVLELPRPKQGARAGQEPGKGQVTPEAAPPAPAAPAVESETSREVPAPAPEEKPKAPASPVATKVPPAAKVAVPAAPTEEQTPAERRPGQAMAFAGGPTVFPTAPQARGEPVSAHGIIARMEREFGVPMRVGRLRGKPLGIYKRLAEVVRLKPEVAADLGVGMHEVAHHLDNKTDILKKLPFDMAKELGRLDYEYPEKRRKNEGFAEYMKLLVVNEAEARRRAPRFSQRFDDWRAANPDWDVRIRNAQNLIDQWKGQTPLERAKASISETGNRARPAGETLRERLTQSLKDKAKAFYRNAVDSAFPTREFDKAYQEATGKKLSPGSGLHDIVTAFTRSAPHYAAKALRDGIFSVGADSFMRKIGPGMKDLVKAFGDHVPDGERYKDWAAYVWARQTREQYGRGQTSALSQSDADAIYQQFRDEPGWEQAAQTLTEINNAAVDMLATAGRHGVISQADAETIKKEWVNYFPLKALRERSAALGFSKGQALVNVGSPIKKRHGGQYQILDPVQATMTHVAQLYDVALKQSAIERAVDMAESAHGLGGWIEEIPPDNVPTRFSAAEVRAALADAGVDPATIGSIPPEVVLTIWRPEYFYRGPEPIARVLRPGPGGQLEPHRYYFDKEFFGFLEGMDEVRLGPFLRTLATLGRIQKLGMTGLSTQFGARNILRDFFTYLGQKREAVGARSVIRPLEMDALLIMDAVRRMAGKPGDPFIDAFFTQGGKMANPLGFQQKDLAKVRREFMGSKEGRLLEAVKHPVEAAERAVIEPLEKAVGFTDYGPRLAEYAAVLEREGLSKDAVREIISGRSPLSKRDTFIHAINAARDVTTNFNRRGAKLGPWNQVWVYCNAAIQGTDKFVRTFRDNPKRALLYSAATAALAMLYWLWHRDDDWYKEQPSWLRNGFFGVSDGKGQLVGRLPLPREWGLAWSGTLAMLDSLYQKDPQFAKDFGVNAADTVAPSPSTLSGMPIVETIFNYDLFRRAPVETEAMRSRLPQERYTRHTTWLMRKVGEKTGLPPERTEFLAEGLTGGLFGRVVRPVEGLAGAGKPAEFSETPFVGAFGVRDEYNRSTEEFYRAAELAEQTKNSARDRAIKAYLADHPGADREKAAKHAALAVPKDVAAEAAFLQDIRQTLSRLREITKEAQGREEAFKTGKFEIGLARMATGKEPLARYPNLFAPGVILTPTLKAIRDKELASKAAILARERPHEPTREKTLAERREEWERAHRQAADFLTRVGASKEATRAALIQHLKDTTKDAVARVKALQRFDRAMQPAEAAAP